MSDAHFEKNIADPIYKFIMKALENGDELLTEHSLKSLIYEGWYDFRKAGRIEEVTTSVFETYLRNKVNQLVDLAPVDPMEFNNRIGRIKRNYWLVATKTVNIFIEGGRFTSCFGQAYDGTAKETQLLKFNWISFYLTLKDRLQTLQVSLGQKWALVAVELRCRELDDETKRCTTWLKSCPFATDFNEAIRTYSWETVEACMDLDDPNWFF